jgi:succinate dehydrogenase/fumarate reductase flavoprotein subunit
MAGLVAAARLRELGHPVIVREKGDRAGGSMLLSSCVVWRHLDWDAFRGECPGGDERLQRLVWERLDEALDWLVARGAPVVWEETGNPRTRGKRFDPRGLVAALDGDAAELESAELPAGEALLLCTGGFGASEALVGRYVAPKAPLRLRGNPWSTGDGLEHAVRRGAALTGGLGQFYGRNMPDAAWGEGDFVPLSQLYAKVARIFDRDGVEFFAAGAVSWSETNVVQATAHRPGAIAYYVLDEQALVDPAVAKRVASAPSRVPLDELPFTAPAGSVAAVRVVASITHTIGGVVVDERSRVLGGDGGAIDGLWAAGVDAGGVATGGYASGLAQALVQGLAAAEDIAGV